MIKSFGDRYYVKATATITDDTESESAVGYARESFDKKGMDDSQITGAASTYARKYALNGLLAIDDTDDADSMDNTKTKPMAAPITPTTGVWDSVSVDMQIYLKELAAEAQGFLDAGMKHGACEVISMAKLSQEHEIALWTLFGASDRDAMKKEFNAMKKWDELGIELQSRLVMLAVTVKDLIRGGKARAAVETIKAANLIADHQAALTTQFDSKELEAMKKEQALMKKEGAAK